MRLRWAAVVLGVGLALIAIRLDDRRAAWAALGVLGFALVLRFAIPHPEGSPGDDGEEPPDMSGPSSAA